MSTLIVAGTVVPIPASLQVANTCIIYSSVTYTYVPVAGYVISKAGAILNDFAYTRPRSPNVFSTTRHPAAARPPDERA